MIKFFVWILFRENLSFDLGKKFGREQADSLISRPNYGLNIQEPFLKYFQLIGTVLVIKRVKIAYRRMVRPVASVF